MDSSREAQLPESAAGLLGFARGRRAEADRAEADLLEAAVGWAVLHPAESVHQAETMHLRGFGDTGIPVAGPGAPLVAEFSVAEFAAAIGLPTEAGKRYLGQAVELCYRLPRLWRRVTTGDLAAWKARRVAEQTTHLSMPAARYLDRHLAPVAHKIRPAQVDRLLDEALGRFMPAEAERRRREAADSRHFSIDHDQVSFAGTSLVTGELDLADALDLDHAVAAGAQRQADLGSTQPLDVRRAIAIGEIARRDLVLDYPATAADTPPGTPGTPAESPADTPADAPAGTPVASPADTAAAGPVAAPVDAPAADPQTKPGRRPGRRPAKRTTVLHLHLSESAIRRPCTCGAADAGAGTPGAAGIGRVENTRTPVTAETIREWCGRPDTHLVVKPVRDLAEHVSVEAYEVADRISEAVALRDISCVFPWCSRPARKLRPDEHATDCDHILAHAQGGPTCSCQIAPLCRRHHRLKTHGGWRYHTLEPGSYVWTSPHRYQYLRDHTGTLDISRDRHHCHPPPPADDTPPRPPTGDT